MKKLLILSEYSANIASARARIFAFLPRLERDGYVARVSCVTERFTAREPRGARVRRLALVLKTLLLAPRFDVVLVHRLFPRPVWLSRALRMASRRLVLDYDESYHVDHRGEDVPASALTRLQAMTAQADCTVVSNEYLREYARRDARAVIVIPTPVDVPRYQRHVHANGSRVVLGWIGSGGAQEYLGMLTGVFTRLHRTFGDRVCLEVITAPAYRVTLQTPLPMQHIDWTLEHEFRYFDRFDIGLMPLTANRRSLGKASYKALQYMAAAIPPVASPVGTNVDCIEQGVTGFLPQSDEEWYDVLCRLIEDPELRQRVGDRGREVVEEHFSVDRWYPVFRGALEGALPSHAGA